MRHFWFITICFIAIPVCVGAKDSEGMNDAHKIIYPYVATVNELRRLMAVSDPEAEELWRQDSSGVSISIYKSGRNIYICGYAFDPKMAKFVDRLTKWEVVDADSGKPVALEKAGDSDEKQLSASVATVDSENNYAISVFYFGQRIGVPKSIRSNVRIKLENINRALDLDANSLELLRTFEVQSKSEFKEIPNGANQ